MPVELDKEMEIVESKRARRKRAFLRASEIKGLWDASFGKCFSVALMAAGDSSISGSGAGLSVEEGVATICPGAVDAFSESKGSD